MNIQNIIIQVDNDELYTICGLYLQRLADLLDAEDTFHAARCEMNLQQLIGKLEPDQQQEMKNTIDEFLAMTTDQRQQLLLSLTGKQP